MAALAGSLYKVFLSLGKSPAIPGHVCVTKPGLTNELLARAEQGDERALATVRAIFDASPACWDRAGNVATMAEEVLVRLVAGDGALSHEAIHRKLAALKANLAGPTACPLERLLSERVVLCWLQVHQADERAARRASQHEVAGGDYDQRRQDRAHKRYLSALHALAQFRRLQIPAVQVNIGAQQVNALQISAERKADP